MLLPPAIAVHLGGMFALLAGSLFGAGWGLAVALVALAPLLFSQDAAIIASELVAVVVAASVVRRGQFIVPTLAVFWPIAAAATALLAYGANGWASPAMLWTISGLASAAVADGLLLVRAVGDRATGPFVSRGFGPHIALPLSIAACGASLLVGLVLGPTAYAVAISVCAFAAVAAMAGSFVIGQRVASIYDRAVTAGAPDAPPNRFLDLGDAETARKRIDERIAGQEEAVARLSGEVDDGRRAYLDLLKVCHSLEERLELRGAEIEERSYLLDLSQKHYRDVLEQATDIIFTLDLEGKFVDINAAGEKFFGRRISAIAGKRWHQILAPGYDPSLGAESAMVPILDELHTKGEYATTTVVQAADDEIRLLDTRLELDRDEEGMPMSISGVARDVTELDGLQRQVQELGESLDAQTRRDRQRTLELAAMLRAARSLNSELEIDQLLQHIIESVAGMIGAESGFVGLLDEGALALRWYWRASGASWIDLEGPGVEQGITSIVIETREPYLCADAATDPNSDKEFTRRFDVRSMLLLPIFNQSSSVLGAMALHNFPVERREGAEARVAADVDMRLLEGLADVAAAAIQQSRLFEQVRQQAETDPLTGLFNRRAFNTRFELEVERAHRFNRSFALLLLDIDHLKKINDSFGHPIGDAAICTVADVLQSRLRRNDFAARIGGEEFAVLIVDGKADSAGGVARSLLESLRKRDVPRAGHITASLGIAVYPEDGETRDELFHLADQALYHAKNSGRNRVVHIRDMAPNEEDASAS